MAVSLAGAALAKGRARTALAAPAVLKRGTKLTFWGGLIFSDKANKTLVDAIHNWGADNGILTEVVMINQNETVQKVSAAVASGTMPDALDLSLDLLLHRFMVWASHFPTSVTATRRSGCYNPMVDA